MALPRFADRPPDDGVHPDPLRDVTLRLAVESSSLAGVAAIDFEGRQLYVNRTLADMVGWPAEELVGALPPFVYWPPEELERIEAVLLRILRGGPLPGGEELIFQRRNGERFPVRVSGAPLLDGAGEQLGWLASVDDMTEWKRTEAEQRSVVVAARGRAERAASRMAFLADASRLLSEALGPAQALVDLASYVVRTIADYAITYLVEAGRVRRVGAAHADPRKQPLLDRLLELEPPAVSENAGPAEVIRTGVTAFEQTIPDSMLEGAAQDAEHLMLLRALAPRSSIVVPLRARGQTLGALALAMTADSGRIYGESDVVLIEELGRRAALEVDNARLLEVEQRARALAQCAAARTARLLEITTALSRAVPRAEAVFQIIEQAIAEMGAEAGGIVELSADGKDFTLTGTVGLASNVVRTYSRFPADVPLPIGDVARTGEPVFLGSPEEWNARYPTPPRRQGEPATDGAWAAVPMHVDGRLIGGLTLSFASRRTFTEAERDFILAVAGQCGQALVRARLYEAERMARSAAEAANRAKDQFLATMSHELRTPFTAILGFTELLRAEIPGPLNDQQKGQLDRIKAASTHLLHLIDEVLTFARTEAGKENAAMQEVDLAGLVAETVAIVQPEAESHGLRLRVDETAGPMCVITDPGKVRQILVNLVGNAIKFTRQGEVRVSVVESPDGVRVRVRDSGIGIAPKDLARIFEPFEQVDAGTTRRNGGTGLGLTVSRRLARLLGGEIEVESRLGVGSTFALRLPCGPTSAAAH